VHRNSCPYIGILILQMSICTTTRLSLITDSAASLALCRSSTLDLSASSAVGVMSSTSRRLHFFQTKCPANLLAFFPQRYVEEHSERQIISGSGRNDNSSAIASVSRLDLPILAHWPAAEAGHGIFAINQEISAMSHMLAVSRFQEQNLDSCIAV